MEGLSTTQNARHGLKSRTRYINLRLLCCKAAASSLCVKPQFPGTGIFCTVLIFHMSCPDAPCSTKLSNLFQKVEVGVEKEREPGCKLVNINTALYGMLHITKSIQQCERQFLGSGGACLPDMVAANRNGVELWHLISTKFNGICNNPHMISGWVDPLFLSSKLLQDIILKCPSQIL